MLVLGEEGGLLNLYLPSPPPRLYSLIEMYPSRLPESHLVLVLGEEGGLLNLYLPSPSTPFVESNRDVSEWIT